MVVQSCLSVRENKTTKREWMDEKENIEDETRVVLSPKGTMKIFKYILPMYSDDR